MQPREAALGESALAAGEDPLRIGMIGAGFIAQVAHLYAFSCIPKARIVALAEPHDGLREAVSQRFSIKYSTADYRELLRQSDIDGVVICVPRRAQSRLVAEFLSENQAVLSEKPMATTLAEAEHMVAMAQRSGAPWMVGYMKRHDKGVQQFAQLLSEMRTSGEFGEILHVGMRDFCANYGIARPEYIARQGARPIRYPECALAPDFVPKLFHVSYDYTTNVVSHDINLLRMFFGDALAAIDFSVHPGGLQRASFDANGIPISLVAGPIDLGAGINASMSPSHAGAQASSYHLHSRVKQVASFSWKTPDSRRVVSSHRRSTFGHSRRRRELSLIVSVPNPCLKTAAPRRSPISH